MDCPKCFGKTDTVIADGADVERCQECHGLYFDRLTQAMLDDLLSCLDIDTGSDELGAVYDEMVYVDCPKCDRIMDQRLIEEPNRIRFEVCPTCYAAFLDAGEFRQYSEPGYLEGFRSLLPES